MREITHIFNFCKVTKVGISILEELVTIHLQKMISLSLVGVRYRLVTALDRSLLSSTTITMCRCIHSSPKRPSSSPASKTKLAQLRARGVTIKAIPKTAATRKYSTDDNKNNSKYQHQLFEEQLKELEKERRELFGGEGEVNHTENSIEQHQKLFDNQLEELQEERQMLFGNEIEQEESNQKSNTYKEQTKDYQAQEELKEQREDLYGFTDEERTAWSNMAKEGEGNSSILKEIEEARAALQQAKLAAESDTLQRLQQQQQRQQQQQQQQEIPIKLEEENQSASLTHLTKDGTSVNMVDVGDKEITKRIAKAQCKVVLPREVLEAMGITSIASPDDIKSNKKKDLVGPKGPIFATAKLAGIMAAKRTSDLIPLCHPLPLDKVTIDIQLDENDVVVIQCECRVTHKTGVEMEALTGASVAALTIYDMVKAISHNVRIEQTILIGKSGGKRTVGPY